MKSIVGLVLGIFGSIINLFVFLFFAVIFLIVVFVNDIVASGSTLSSFIGSVGLWSVLLGIWFLVFAVLGFIFSGYLNNPLNVRKGSIGCLFVGLLTINIFLFLGGFLGFLASRE